MLLLATTYALDCSGLDPHVCDAVSTLEAAHGLTEAHSHRQRPSVLAARLQAQRDAMGCEPSMSFTATWSGKDWSGTIDGHPVAGRWRQGEWWGSTDATLVYGGALDGPTRADAHYAGSPLAVVLARAAGRSGYAAGVGGCAVSTAALAGQSNAHGGRFGPSGPLPVGASLMVSSIDRAPAWHTVYPNRTSVEQDLFTAIPTVFKHYKRGVLLDTWIAEGHHARVLSATAAEGLTPSITVWIHGEADARLDEADRQSYGTRLSPLLDDLVAAWGPQLFIWPELSSTDIGPERCESINASMRALADQRRDIVIVPTGGLYQPDGLHYTHLPPGSYGQLGARVLQAAGL